MSAIYLAARFSRKRELQGYARRLADLGVNVTSRWLRDGAHEWTGTPDHLIPHVAQAAFAGEDLEDVATADAFVLFTEEVNRHGTRGGRMVELGYALALKKNVAIIGPRENVFCHLVTQYETFDAFLADMKLIERVTA